MVIKHWLAAVLALAPLAVSSAAFAQSTPPPDEPLTVHLTVYDTSGSHAITGVKPGDDLQELLKSKELELKDFRLASGETVADERLSQGETLDLYKHMEEATSTVVPLAYSVTEEKTDTLPLGETQVKEEGALGSALKTVVVSKLATLESTSTSELLIVTQAPKNKVVLVGTKTEEKPPEEAAASSVVTPEEAPPSNAAPAPTPTPTVPIPAASAAPTSSAVRTPTPEPSAPPMQGTEGFVQVLKAQVGKPYVWGAAGPDAFDCSGLVTYALNKSGHPTARLTAAGFGAKAKKVAVSAMQPGDIIWTGEHIGVYIGNGKMIHAATPEQGVVVSDVSWFLAHGYQVGRLS